MTRIHLDTDFAGDTDDACALALLLGWPDVEITGITTTIDPGGRRAGYLRYFLDLAGRSDIPIAAGAELSLSRDEPAGPEDKHWPENIAARPDPPGPAQELLRRSVESGATIVAIGPYTNLTTLPPGAPVVAMGGWIDPPAAGLPSWGADMDFNVQWDIRAARVLADTADLSLVTLPATLKSHIRKADLPVLRGFGPLGELLARQALLHGGQYEMPALGLAHSGLPDDLLNFQYDPVACAVALGWAGATVHTRRLRPTTVDGLLRFMPDPAGREMRVVTDIDGPAFSELWLDCVKSAG
jgi:inosine-uridine nucleoside N-ribohydrolase